MKHKLLDEWWKTSINCGKQSDYLGVTLNICESLLEGDDWKKIIGLGGSRTKRGVLKGV